MSRELPVPSERLQKSEFPLGMWGVILLTLGIAVFSVTALLNLPLRFLFPSVSVTLREVVWWAGFPVVIGVAALVADFLFFYRRRRAGHELSDIAPANSQITVALTAFNDQESIGDAVQDFLEHPLTKRVIVVDNNSSDNTAAFAALAGAEVFLEPKAGYGNCVFRALAEGSKFEDTEVVALCEGDLTFRARDLDKLIAYLPHADVVNGTRIVEQLRQKTTQLTTFMFWGNFVGGKILEFKHLGRGTVTDLGTTYKLARSSFLRQHLHEFNPKVNLEFNAHFLDTVLSRGHKLVEAPVTFYQRVGISKGGNVSNRRATRVGLKMLVGLLFSWSLVAGRV